MKLIYLYIKTHNITGLKYLGKTTQNPFKYRGSGLYWLSHLKKHGDDVSTEIIFTSDSKDEIRQKAIELSDLWSIVKSDDWANLKPEIGDGGGISDDDAKRDYAIRRENGRRIGLMNVVNGHLKRITNTKHFLSYLSNLAPEEKSALSRVGGSRSWINRDKAVYINQDWYKKLQERASETLKAIPKERRIENARHSRDHLSKERIKEIAASGGRIGGKVSGRNNVLNGHFDKVRQAAYVAKRGKKWFTNPITGETAFFKEGDQPADWVIGRLNFNPANTWSKDRIWVTDGKIQMTVPIDKIPEGFVRGHLGKDGKVDPYTRLALRLAKRKMAKGEVGTAA